MIPPDVFNIMLPYFIVGVLSLLVGMLFGSLISSAGKKPKSSAKEAHSSLFRELFTVLQHRKSGAWVVEIEGRKFRIDRDLSAAQKSSILRILNNLVEGLGGTPSSPTAAPSVRPSISISDLGKSGVQEPVGLDVVDALSQAMFVGVDESTLEEGPISIVRQVNDILQRKLREAQMPQKAVQLVEMPSKGMVVMVGLQQYDHVDDVPDDEIRALIRESVREWEDQVARGSGL